MALPIKMEKYVLISHFLESVALACMFSYIYNNGHYSTAYDRKNEQRNKLQNQKTCSSTQNGKITVHLCNEFLYRYCIAVKEKKAMVENQYRMIPFFVVGEKIPKPKTVCVYNYNTFEWVSWQRFCFLLINVCTDSMLQRKVSVFG